MSTKVEMNKDRIRIVSDLVGEFSTDHQHLWAAPSSTENKVLSNGWTIGYTYVGIVAPIRVKLGSFDVSANTDYGTPSLSPFEAKVEIDP